MKITKEQYLDAVLIIENYHEQIIREVKKLDDKFKTSTRVFIEKCIDKDIISTRLYNILNNNISTFPYLEDIHTEELMKCMYMGKKCLKEFIKLRTDYINKII